jgi:hypothetical protein
MAAPVVLPIHQFCDANGKPYAGGSIATYVPSTTTPKATYLDEGLTALNPNPVVLDAAGRATMWGDGDFRLILSDISGNLIWDITATSIVSAAMDPVVSAATIDDALNLLGVTALIDAEATARSEADNALQAQRNSDITTLNNSIAAEAQARTNADTNLQNELNNEIARAKAAEAALADSIASGAGGGFVRAGTLTTDATGNFTVTFSPPFATKCIHFTVFDPNGSFDGGTGLFTGYISVLGWPGTTGPGGLTATKATGQLIMQQLPTGGTPSYLDIITPTTVDWLAEGY